MSNYHQFVDSFIEFEKEHDLFKHVLPTSKNEHWYWWSSLRVECFDYLVEKKNLLGVKGIGRRQKIKKPLLPYLKSLTLKNPFLFAQQKEVLFIGHPRRKLNPTTNLYEDIYCDYLQGNLNSNHFEIKFQGKHLEPAASKNSFHLDSLYLFDKILTKVFRHKIQLNPQQIQEIHEIEIQFLEIFGESPPLKKWVQEQISQWSHMTQCYRILLKKVKPKIICLVISYGNEWVISAAQSLGIPVAELQHGTISPVHLGYHFPYEKKQYFPDYFLSFGKSWTASVAMPLPIENCIPIGYPFLESKIGSQPKQNSLTIISQPTVGKELLKFTLKLLELKGLPEDFKIIYRLHPEEINHWESIYPELKNQKIEMMPHLDLYQCFEISKWVLGVYSTALFEALLFNTQLFLLNTPGVEGILQILQPKKDCLLIKEPDEFFQNMHQKFDSNIGQRFFTPKAQQEFSKFIQKFL